MTVSKPLFSFFFFFSPPLLPKPLFSLICFDLRSPKNRISFHVCFSIHSHQGQGTLAHDIPVHDRTNIDTSRLPAADLPVLNGQEWCQKYPRGPGQPKMFLSLDSSPITYVSSSGYQCCSMDFKWTISLSSSLCQFYVRGTLAAQFHEVCFIAKSRDKNIDQKFWATLNSWQSSLSQCLGTFPWRTLCSVFLFLTLGLIRLLREILLSSCLQGVLRWC